MVRNWFQTSNEYKLLIVLGGFFFVFLIAISGTLLYAAFEEIIDGGTASLSASLLLVILTGAYAFITLWMTHETKKSRRQEIQPVLEFRPHEHRSTIVNLGSGPARNIDLTLTLEPKGESHRVQWQSLAPQQEIAIPAEPFSSIADREYLDLQLQGADIDWESVEDDEEFWDEFDDYPYEQLRMTGSCEDVWENLQEVEERYDVWNLTEAMVGTVPSTMEEKSSLELVAVELSSLRALVEDTVKESNRSESSDSPDSSRKDQ
jgi:hypothetical protein